MKTINISHELDKSYYVRSKISFQPLSHSILPIPDGLSVIIFENINDIKEYFINAEITDIDDFETIKVLSIYDLMIEVADIGYTGFWYYNSFPILFGNHVNDLDNALPTLMYTFNNVYIGASGLLKKPKIVIPWHNFEKTDKILQKKVLYIDDTPFNINDQFYTLINPYINTQAEGKILAIEQLYVSHSASPLQGDYISDMGAYSLFTDQDEAESFLNRLNSNDIVDIHPIDDLMEFLKLVEKDYPFIDIGVNPAGKRYIQGYFFLKDNDWFVRTVLGFYKINSLISIDAAFDKNSIKKDTVESLNNPNQLLTKVQTTIKYPLKNYTGSTGSRVSNWEFNTILEEIITNNKYKNKNIEEERVQISSDTYLMYCFDKVSGNPITNNSDNIMPYLFDDFIDAVLFIYFKSLPFDFDLRLNGYHYCGGNRNVTGSEDKEKENFRLTSMRRAITELIRKVFIDGYSVDSSIILMNFINRSSISLKIEQCGYLGDMAIFNYDYLDKYYENNDEHNVCNKIQKIANKYSVNYHSNTSLNNKYQNKLSRYVGMGYKNLTHDSKLILESSVKEYENSENQHNHDYAGISMKLCKVFEREINILVFKTWRESASIDRSSIKNLTNTNDFTTKKLAGYLLKKNKLEIGPIRYTIIRLMSNCDNELLMSLKKHIEKLHNSDFILSDDFDSICNLISNKYRNGGVHEKVVSYKVCKEAFNEILIKDGNYLSKLLNY